MIRADGVSEIGLLRAILRFPPDQFVEQPVVVMGPEDNRD